MRQKDDEKYAKAAAKLTKRHGLFLRTVAALVTCAVLVRMALYYTSRQDLGEANEPTLTAASKLNNVLRKNQITNNGGTDVVPPVPTLGELDTKVAELDATVREIKARVDIFETDEEGQAAAKQLQEATRQVLHRRFGSREPYRVVVDLEFQPTIKDFEKRGSHGSFTIELAPSSLQPHSIHTFLEVARQWHGGAFHRIAGHVLQVMVNTHTVRHLAFQEYSPSYPHKKGTVGYAGRPSGPAWYVSIQDNSSNHGPGSQQDHNPFEADSCFGTIIEGFDEHVLRITKVDGRGFLGDAKKHVLIKTMTIQVPGEDGTYEVWSDEQKATRQADSAY